MALGLAFALREESDEARENESRAKSAVSLVQPLLPSHRALRPDGRRRREAVPSGVLLQNESVEGGKG